MVRQGVETEDQPIQWYDFGGNTETFVQPDGKTVAALWCCKNGLFYYLVCELEGEGAFSSNEKLRAEEIFRKQLAEKGIVWD